MNHITNWLLSLDQWELCSCAVGLVAGIALSAVWPWGVAS